MTREERDEIMYRIYEAMRAGNMEEAIALAKKRPLSPDVAISVRDVYGAEALKNSGFNLSKAEEAYGKDWLSV